VLVFAPVSEHELAGIPGFSVGIVSATQGVYSQEQLLLDITQGARVAASSYSSSHPPPLRLRATGAGGEIVGWQAARRRAQDAPQLLRPGLLAAQIPGGAAYAGIGPAADAGTANHAIANANTRATHTDAVAAANRQGRVSAISLGSAATLLTRVAALRSAHRLVLADLPSGRTGREDLRTLSASRRPRELLLVLQRATQPAHGHELLWAAAAGLGTGTAGGSEELTSQTTTQRGLIAAIDIAPTILRHLAIAVPADMRGASIRTDGPLHSTSLRALMARLHVITPRRLPAFGWLLVAWLALIGVCALADRARHRGPTVRPRAWAMRTWAVRVGAVGMLWTPVAVLIPAALESGAAVEYATIALACLALGAATDRLLPWPRAPLAPAVVVVAALTADALAGTQLLIRSLLGPNPILGARFYGIGNELKSGLAVLVFAAVAAAATYPSERGSPDGRRAALTMAGAGIVLAVVEGSARIGAGVGGVILVCAGTAVAVAILLPGALTRRRALSVLIAPVVGLIVLAGLDLAFAHGTGHFTGSVLHVRSAEDVRDIVVRRYTAAWDELRTGAMPVATAVAALCAAFGIYRRERLLAVVGGEPVWLAAFSGGLTAGVVGALVEDSGPVLLVVAVFALGCVLAYLWAGGVPADRALPRYWTSTGRAPAGDASARCSPSDPKQLQHLLAGAAKSRSRQEPEQDSAI
jgi:hypothetical protein